MSRFCEVGIPGDLPPHFWLDSYLKRESGWRMFQVSPEQVEMTRLLNLHRELFYRSIGPMVYIGRASWPWDYPDLIPPWWWNRQLTGGYDA